MKVKNFFKFITNNFWAKMACLLLAMALWIYVGMGQTKNTTFPGGLPLQINNVTAGLVAVTDTDTVNIKIIAASDVFNKLSFDSFSAYLDLNGLGEGTYEINPTVVSHVQNVTVVEVNPAKVVVRIEPKVSKTVKVNCLYDGKPADGMAPGQCITTPENATVSGARSVINALDTATAKITLQGEAADFSKMVKLTDFDSNGKEIKNITFSPEQVNVKVPIVKASTIKTVGIKVTISGLPADGYWVSKIETDPATVTVTAAENLIGSIGYVPTSAVDVSGLNKNKVIQTTLNPQSGVVLMDQVSQITVTLTISKNQSAREFEVGYKWVNLVDNLKVTSTDPSTVKVVVTGTSDQLSRLSASDLSLVVDLSGLNDPGTHSVDISRSNISGPTGISVSSIVPSAINVRIDTK